MIGPHFQGLWPLWLLVTKPFLCFCFGACCRVWASIWVLLLDWDFGPFGPNSLTVTPHSPNPSPQLGLWGIISLRADRGSGRVGWLLALAYLFLRGHVASCLWYLLCGTSFDEMSFRVLAVPLEDRPLIFLATRGAPGAWMHLRIYMPCVVGLPLILRLLPLLWFWCCHNRLDLHFPSSFLLLFCWLGIVYTIFLRGIFLGLSFLGFPLTGYYP